MNLRHISALSFLLRLLGTASLFIVLFEPFPIHPWIPLGFLLLFFGGSAYLDYHWWRCPYCGKHLGKRMFPLPSACPHCHHPLDGKSKRQG